MSEWRTPRFIEVAMNAEIGGYSDDLAEVDTLPSEPDVVPAGDPPGAAAHAQAMIDPAIEA